MYDPILVPVDGSDTAARAAAEGFRIAEELGSTVHLLFVVDESAAAMLLTSETMADRLERLRGEAHEFLAELADTTDVPVETAVVRGMKVHRAIIDYAETEGIGLIVMGSRGRSGPGGILGSTSERVAANTAIPVLLVSDPASEDNDSNEDGDASADSDGGRVGSDERVDAGADEERDDAT
ncbi:MAG: universal stress protein [Haloglomus sp.]